MFGGVGALPWYTTLRNLGLGFLWLWSDIRMGNVAWKVYEGKEPLEAFLNRNRPSKIQHNEASWISVPYQQKGQSDDNEREEEEEETKSRTVLKAEWNGLLKKSVKHVTAETLKDLAVKYNYTTGKWMIFANRLVWQRIFFSIFKSQVISSYRSNVLGQHK